MVFSLQLFKQSFAVILRQHIRHFAYTIYRVYKSKLERKLPVYDFQTIDVIRQLPEDAVCMDIGVNEGQILYYLKKYCYKGKIIAIEPIPGLAAFLKSKYENQNITIEQVALFDKEGETSFFYFPRRNALSGLRSRGLQEDLDCIEIKVPVKKMDGIFKGDRLDFIKIDVEGAEFNILNGGQETLRRFHPLLVFESGKGGIEYYNHTAEDLFDLLQSLGYAIATLNHYLGGKAPFSKDDFLLNFGKGYDFQFIAYPILHVQ